MEWTAFEITLAVWAETEKALLLSADGSEESAVWCPKCWVDVVEQPSPATIVASVPLWKARELGWSAGPQIRTGT